MAASTVKERVLAALSLLEDGRRDEAAAILSGVIADGPPTGTQWKSISRLAAQIGEIELALEASRRCAATIPVKLSALLEYWRDLIAFGRPEVAEADIARLGQSVTEHPAVLHVRGQLAAQRGEFATAESFYCRLFDQPAFAPHAWFSLSMISDMQAHPDWIDRMAALERENPQMAQADRSRLLYALGKAYHDCGDYGRAAEYYAQGAASRRSEAQYDPARIEAAALALMRDFDAAALERLAPPQHRERASIFVHGLPRSGTTLVEQILAAHTAVHDGAEVNLVRPALIPTQDYSFSGALAYQERRTDLADPWGSIGLQYRRMLDMRFRTKALVVDKSLNQSRFMGLIGHALPDCPLIWMRRDPADAAISCYRTFFTAPLPWCWRFEDMGHFFAVEDALFSHWARLLGDRLLTVDYQDLVRDPSTGMRQIIGHAKLDWEDGIDKFHESDRPVRTASLQQVRKPISPDRVGQADAYAQWMDPFWRSYEETAKRVAEQNISTTFTH